MKSVWPTVQSQDETCSSVLHTLQSGAMVDARIDQREQRYNSRCDSVRATSLAASWCPGWPCLGAAATPAGDRSIRKWSYWLTYDASLSVRCRARARDHTQRQRYQWPSRKSAETVRYSGRDLCKTSTSAEPDKLWFRGVQLQSERREQCGYSMKTDALA